MIRRPPGTSGFFLFSTGALLSLFILFYWARGETSTAIALFFLPGFWVISIIAKRKLGIGTHTAFADLSFASGVYVAAYSYRQISEFSSLAGQYAILPFIFAFPLVFTWIVALSLDKRAADLIASESVPPLRLIPLRFFSLVAASVSLSLALFITQFDFHEKKFSPEVLLSTFPAIGGFFALSFLLAGSMTELLIPAGSLLFSWIARIAGTDVPQVKGDEPETQNRN